MERTLKISVDCGEKTCASEPGNFCRFMGSVKFGQVPVCTLFPDVKKGETYTILGNTKEDDTGWVLRCQSCMALEESDA